ncbi:hypothetical protein EJ08DRAFT_15360 [Tothia fuscella]|uniref:Uncharacterized protein n=1 Tax=Tothia fuscella TaxID=1048955 RepID=A0A9P4U5N3_9PEZI|nr:hypothetical protein EJ08DRAFT_15360 [Tothia fuscella]
MTLLGPIDDASRATEGGVCIALANSKVLEYSNAQLQLKSIYNKHLTAFFHPVFHFSFLQSFFRCPQSNQSLFQYLIDESHHIFYSLGYLKA